MIKTAEQKRRLKLAIRNGVTRRSAHFVFSAVLEKLFDAGNVHRQLVNALQSDEDCGSQERANRLKRTLKPPFAK